MNQGSSLCDHGFEAIYWSLMSSSMCVQLKLIFPHPESINKLFVNTSQVKGEVPWVPPPSLTGAKGWTCVVPVQETTVFVS